ncbi:MAG: hypothetical protein AB8B64_00635 [Granulosicoccus sp.]
MTCSACGVGKNKGDYCNYCGTLYPEALKADQAQSTAPVSSLASKYQVERTQDSLSIWWNWRSLPLLAFLAFSVFWMYIATSSGSIWPTLVGVVMIVYIVIQFVNRTTINVTNNGLSIHHRPIPCRKGFKFHVGNIQQIYVSKEQKRSKNRIWHAPALQLVTSDGKRHAILKGQSETEFADFEALRRKILSELGIEPRSAFGEFSE